MRRSRGIGGFVATLVLVTITLSLSYVVYEGVSRFSAPKEVVFSNQALTLAGTPEILEVEVNSSSPTVPQVLQADDASSSAGILDFNGTTYGTTDQLCLAGSTTFFSVYASTAGLLQATASGRVWIDGYWTSSLRVTTGWHELMFSDASRCTVIPPDGSPVSVTGRDVSSLPLIWSVPSEAFTAFVPTEGARHSLVLVFDGGYDRLA